VFESLLASILLNIIKSLVYLICNITYSGFSLELYFKTSK